MVCLVKMPLYCSTCRRVRIEKIIDIYYRACCDCKPLRMRSMKASKDAYDSMFEPGTKLSAEGGQVELVKVHTASRLYPTVHFGSYLQTNDDDLCYIDVVLDV